MSGAHVTVPLALVALFGLAGCAFRDAGQRELPVTPEVPAAWSEEASAEAEPLTGWCSDFGDPQIEAFVERALDANFTLRSGWARLAQAQALVRQAESAEYPRLSLEAGAGRARAASAFGPVEGNQFSVSLPAAYEVDLWNRIGNTADAAALDAEAARADIEGLVITLSAQVAEAWFDAVQLRATLRLIDRQVEVSERFRELVMLRLGVETGAPDVYAQQQRIDALQAQRVQVVARLEVTEQRLAVLLGRPPSTPLGIERDALPPLPALPNVGVPADLLTRRPDVRAALLRFHAADHRAAAAVAQRLPGLRLTGALSLSGVTPGQLVEELFWSLFASIAGPLFDGGQGQAEVDRTRAVVDERVYGFGQTLLTAMQEVETALALERRQVEFLGRLRRQAETAAVSLGLERDRYLNGLADYLRVLTALQAQQQTEQQLLEGERQLLSYRVQLCRALGGDWTRALEPPAPLGGPAAADAPEEDAEP
jgi:NodT family efflux transporter outer membrane factor (OMF) lipoprotein